MAETRQIKRLNRKEDLAKLVAGDIVGFGIMEEECLVHDYPIRENEILLISRCRDTSPKGFIGVIYGPMEDFKVVDGILKIDYQKVEVRKDLIRRTLRAQRIWEEDIPEELDKKWPRTPDGKYHYGVSLVIRKAEDPRGKEYEHPEEYDRFDEALTKAGLTE